MDEDLSVNWTLANPLSIQMDEVGKAWNAGAAMDLVALDTDRILVATDTGGVWMAHRDGTSLCLADVDYPDFWCITNGQYGHPHFYAAGRKLYETDLSKNIPLLSWREIQVEWQELSPLYKLLTLSPQAIYRVLVLREDKRIVLATTDGVLWADIPPPPDPPKGCLEALLEALFGTPKPPPVYTWKQAVGLEPNILGYLGVAAGPPIQGELDRSISVVSWGIMGKPAQFYFGRWEGGELVMKKSVMNARQGIDKSKARATTMTSCDTDPSHMYAISANTDGFAEMFWRSTDAGRQWEALPLNLVTPNDVTFSVAAGNAGNDVSRPCNCIAAHRYKSNTVAVGWRVGGFFVSEDNGDTWRRTDTAFSPHTHSDVHGIYFDPTDPTAERIFIAHDGGVSMAPKLGTDPKLFESMYNRQLATLQFQTAPGRMFFGGAGANPSQDGVMIGGLQDNGVVTSSIQPTIEPWIEFDSGDGFQTTFLRNGQALFNNNDDTQPPALGIVRHAFWSVAPKLLVNSQYVHVTKDDPKMPHPAGLPTAPGETVVFSPLYQLDWNNREGEPMYAVAGKHSNIYGLFYSDMGTVAHWEFIATFPLNEILSADDIKAKNWEPWNISAVASFDGNVIYVGTKGGRLIAFDQRTRDAHEIKVPLRKSPFGDNGTEINRIAVAHDNLAFATYNIGRDRLKGDSYSKYDRGYVLKITPYKANVLSALPVEAYYGLEVAREPQNTALYAASDSKVYVSRDPYDGLGDTWKLASRGLPRRPHCGDLSYVTQPNGQRWLYMSTYGRSFWRAPR